MAMKKIVLTGLLLIFVLMSQSTLAKSPASESEKLYLYDAKQAELAKQMNPGIDLSQPLAFAQQTDTTHSMMNPAFPLIKSPRKALLLSAVIPGAGEVYSKAYIFGAAFFAAEVTLWLMYSKYTSKGKDLETEFQMYADDYWSRDDYLEWINSSEAIELQVQRTHELPDTRTQQYYEMIGKYDQFYAGWSDSEQFEYGERGGKRLEYMDMREDSNEQLKKASTMVSIAILNHIVSAVDAAWASYRYNKSHAEKVGTTMQFDTIQYAQEVCPAISLNMRW